MLSDERLQEIRQACKWHCGMFACPELELVGEVDRLRADLADRDAEAMNLRAERDKLKRSCETLGTIVDRQARDVIAITGIESTPDGDADYGLGWELLYEMKAERDRLLIKVRQLEAWATAVAENNR